MSPHWCRWEEGALILKLRVQPRASRDEIAGVQDQRLKVRLTAPPVEGAANRHLVRFLAREFGVPKSRVILVRGEKGREKTLRIESPDRRPGWLECREDGPSA